MRQHRDFNNRLNVLREKYGSLESQIAAEEGRPAPDLLVVQQLKRQQRAVREELAFLETLARAVGGASNVRAA